jgi:hypothetical protein
VDFHVVLAAEPDNFEMFGVIRMVHLRLFGTADLAGLLLNLPAPLRHGGMSASTQFGLFFGGEVVPAFPGSSAVGVMAVEAVPTAFPSRLPALAKFRGWRSSGVSAFQGAVGVFVGWVRAIKLNAALLANPNHCIDIVPDFLERETGRLTRKAAPR